MTAPSSYDPPRHRWYRVDGRRWIRFFWRPRARPDRQQRIAQGATEVILALAVPGRGFALAGHRRAAGMLLILWSASALVMLACLGRPAADGAFALMIFIHAAGVLRVLLDILGQETRMTKLISAFGAWLGLTFLLYFPARSVVVERMVMPLEINGQIVLINRLGAHRPPNRGDVIAYRIESRPTGEVSVGSGFGLSEVLAGPGDRVHISPGEMTINGHVRPREAMMPAEATFVLERKRWLVWPRLGIYPGYHTDPRVSATWLQLGMIDETQYLGRPFRHWFGRRQTLP